jgi:hypothetical protein
MVVAMARVAEARRKERRVHSFMTPNYTLNHADSSRDSAVFTMEDFLGQWMKTEYLWGG